MHPIAVSCVEVYPMSTFDHMATACGALKFISDILTKIVLLCESVSLLCPQINLEATSLHHGRFLFVESHFRRCPFSGAVCGSLITDEVYCQQHANQLFCPRVDAAARGAPPPEICISKILLFSKKPPRNPRFGLSFFFFRFFTHTNSVEKNMIHRFKIRKV